MTPPQSSMKKIFYGYHVRNILFQIFIDQPVV